MHIHTDHSTADSTLRLPEIIKYSSAHALRYILILISWARLSFFAMSAVHVVRLVRGDREFEVSIGRSYSTEQLSRMFNVDPGSIWLRSRYGNEVYFPNPEGVFDLPSERVLPYAEFSVEGESMTRHLQGQASAQSSAGQANTHTPVMQRTPTVQKTGYTLLYILRIFVIYASVYTHAYVKNLTVYIVWKEPVSHAYILRIFLWLSTCRICI